MVIGVGFRQFQTTLKVQALLRFIKDWVKVLNDNRFTMHTLPVPLIV